MARYRLYLCIASKFLRGYLAGMARPGPRSGCPISVALELLGDRWTLLVVRDLVFAGKTRFGEFLESPEAMSTNILADRLERLHRAGIVTRDEDEANRTVVHYRLTRKGADLVPVLLELMAWSCAHETTAAPSSYARRLREDRKGLERELRRAIERGRRERSA